MNFLHSPLLASSGPLRHGFFARDGGVSRGIYASLNCGLGSRDDPGCVHENLRRVAGALGVDAPRLLTLRQTHGNEVLTLGQGSLPQRARADAAVTASAGIGLGITGADCPTVLLADPAARVAGAAHAGWRGAHGGVLEATLAAMSALGARTQHLVAAIGPGIQQPSYEVGAEFRTLFVEADPGNARLFLAAPEARFLFDLPAYIAQRLRAAGVTRVDTLRQDTFRDSTLFSYRRSRRRGEPDYGRQLAVICLTDGGT